MSYRIPLFALNFDRAEEDAVLRTLRSSWISMGPECAAFEEEFAAACGTRYALALANCTVALHVAMEALDVGPGDEVIVPSLTFAATANAVRYVGAEPVFADVESLWRPVIGAAEIERQITPLTRGIIVMHYAGFPVDVDAVREVARSHDLFVVEDACHAPLSRYRDRPVGSLGEVGCFSFFSNKNLSTGEGGMLTTDREDVYLLGKSLRSHGMSTMSYDRARGHATRYDIERVGYNYRLDDIRASIGRVQLAKLPADLARRARVRATYERLLADVEGVVVPFAEHGGEVSNYIMPVVIDGVDAPRRDAIRDRIHAAGIQTSNHYPCVHRFATYATRAWHLPNTEAFSEREISLPMFGSLTDEDVADVVAALRAALAAELKSQP